MEFLQQTQIQVLIQIAIGAIASSIAYFSLKKIGEEGQKSETLLIFAMGILGAILLAQTPISPIIQILLLSFFLIANTQDIKTQTISDKINFGGGGILIAILILEGIFSKSPPISQTLLGAITGVGALLSISWMGKIAFGKRSIQFDPPENLKFLKEEKQIQVGETILPYKNLFQEGKGKIEFFSPTGEKVATLLENGTTKIEDPSQEEPLINQLTTPRDTLGMGDIKFILGLGAICGPSLILVAIVVACATGAILGPLLLQKSTGRIPLAPFLSIGCIISLKWGQKILEKAGW